MSKKGKIKLDIGTRSFYMDGVKRSGGYIQEETKAFLTSSLFTILETTPISVDALYLFSKYFSVLAICFLFKSSNCVRFIFLTTRVSHQADD